MCQKTVGLVCKLPVDLPMSQFPDTRHSLIARLQTGGDDGAWSEFAELYRPVVTRLAMRRGLQFADAEDLAQEVLVSVAGAVERWTPDDSRARFRSWLRRVAENHTLNALMRRKPDRATGESSARPLLNNHPDKSSDSVWLRLEYRRQVFHWAAVQIRGEFHPVTWDAFWQTTVVNREINEVAQELGRSIGAVYAARSRVMQRLREAVQLWDDKGDGP